MTLVLEQAQAGPATHAIVIGVGSYAHLPGGTGPTIPDPQKWGLTQLASPPHSALAFATWLTDRYRNTQSPLATLDLYVSAKDAISFTAKGKTFAVERATWDAVEAGVAAWALRSTKDDDLAIFFFCGHGIARGQLTNLLVEDFGKNPLSAMQKSIRFDDLVLGLEQCRARRQALFVDACRSTPPALDALVGTTLGQPIIEPNTSNRPSAAERDVSWIQGAGTAAAAFAMPGKPSQFTRNLVRALDEGPAWDDNDDPWSVWKVRTESLARRVTELLVLEHEALAVPRQEAKQRSPDHVGFVLHEPDAGSQPKVPVLVRCDPPALTSKATLSISHPGQPKAERAPADEDWCVTLAVDRDYRAEATDPAAKSLGTRDFIVRPPCQRVPIPTGGT